MGNPQNNQQQTNLNNLSPEEREALKNLVKRAARIELSRQSFWYYCQTVAPDFYKDDRPHLRELCDTLQALYEGRIVKLKPEYKWRIMPVAPKGWIVCKKLMINIPPQHGKSRTLVLFSTWVFGRNPSEKIITASYNDETASDFSRYTRDGITVEKKSPEEIVYSDIFPLTRIKKGHGGFEKWALDGQHFSYLGAGVGGSVTSKGATILMVDDPVKGAKEALNINELNRIWMWYSGTFISRVAAKGGEPIEIVNHTRWSKNDLCGRLLADQETGPDWYVLKMEAYNEKTGQMLCPDIFSYKRYVHIKRLMCIAMEEVFYANYHQRPMDIKGAVFPVNQLRRFRSDPGRKFETRTGYVDVADEGNDYLSFPIGKNIGPDIYITKWMFTRLGTEHTIPMAAKLINTERLPYVRVEANNMGATWYKQVQTKTPNAGIYPITSTTNKHTRVMMMAGFIITHCLFLVDDEQDAEYMAAFENLIGYLKEGKVEHDDAADSLSGLVDFIMELYAHYYEPEEDTEPEDDFEIDPDDERDEDDGDDEGDY